jgi:phosphopantothenoylcysteine synthetase/decarboxylase
VRKNLDMIVANNVSERADGQVAIGFNSEYNALHILWRGRNAAGHQEINAQTFATASKSQLATRLISLIAKQYHTGTKDNAQNTAQNS